MFCNFVVWFFFWQFVIGFDIRIKDKKYVWSPVSFAFVEYNKYWRARAIKSIKRKEKMNEAFFDGD